MNYLFQVWFSNRRARLRKTAQTCSSPGYNPLALSMPYTPSYMQQSIMENQETSHLYNSAMQGLSSYANNIMGHTMNQYAAQSTLLTTQVRIYLYIVSRVYTSIKDPVTFLPEPGPGDLKRPDPDPQHWFKPN